MARVKRPLPERSGPIRSWTSAVGSAPERATQDGVDAGAEPPLDNRDPIVRGVVSGSRVVDEWMRQAQQTARLVGGGTSTAAWADTSGRMFKAASDLMGAWWSMVGVPPNGSGPWSARPGQGNHESAWQAKPWTDPMQPDAHSSAPQAADASSSSPGPHVTLEVASRRPVEVTVDLHRPAHGQLRVLDLRPNRGTHKRIRGTTLEASGSDGLRLRLTVPDDQPPGTYHAVVLDPVADCAVGTVTLRIPD